MSTIQSPSGVRIKVSPYENFQGIDASRDKSALDTGEDQHLLHLVDGFADWRGTMVRDPGASPRTDGGFYVKHVAFFGRNLVAWAQRDGGGTTLKSERGQEAFEVYPRNAVVSSAVFNNKLLFFSRDQRMQQYDGFKFVEIDPTSDPKPAYGVAVQRRLAIAGAPSKRTVVDLSRVDKEGIFTDDEDPASEDVTRAGDIDVANIIGTADEIKGLGVFELNRLAIFTNDQTLVYEMHPDLDKWQIDDKANVRIGTISHNSIAQAGSDLLFCSRDGVHSLRRSEVNGIVISSMPMSNKIELLYRRMLREVANPESISAFFDQDLRQYHVFFPVSEMVSKRLTLTIDGAREGEPKWSTGTFLNATCGHALGGVTILGTPGGVWERGYIEDVRPFSPEMVATTPILWQGSITDIKESFSFIIQASGQGELQVEAFDERGRVLSSMQILIEPGGADDSFPDVPLSRQYERRFEHRYRGVQFRFTTRGKGLLKIIGFAVTVRN